MTTLGIGTPVRIGWAPDSQKRCYRQDPRMRPGIIIDGPVHVDPAVELVSDIFGELTIVKYRATYWCTREPGHHGPHVACGTETHAIEVWDQT